LISFIHGLANTVKVRSDLSVAELSAVKIAIKLQRSNALICFNEYTLKRIENDALLRYGTQKCERVFTERLILQVLGQGLILQVLVYKHCRNLRQRKTIILLYIRTL